MGVHRLPVHAVGLVIKPTYDAWSRMQGYDYNSRFIIHVRQRHQDVETYSLQAVRYPHVQSCAILTCERERALSGPKQGRIQKGFQPDYWAVSPAAGHFLCLQKS